MKKWMLLPGVILACCLLTGCFGLAVLHPRQKCTEQFCLGNRGVVSNGSSPILLTEVKVLELWGQPDSKTNYEDLTAWQHRGKMQWAMIVPAYIVAIPLPFPTGHDQTRIYFHDGIACKASRSVPVTTGVFIGTPGVVFAWAKEDYTNRVVVGSGFLKEATPVGSKPKP